MIISSWLNFACPVPPGRGSAAGRKFLAPPYYSQHAVFVSPLSTFSLCSVSLHLYMLSYQYLPNDCLERLLWGSLFMVRQSCPPGQDWRALMTFSLVYHFIVLLCVYLVRQPCTICLILLWHNIACYSETAIKHQSTGQPTYCIAALGKSQSWY